VRDRKNKCKLPNHMVSLAALHGTCFRGNNTVNERSRSRSILRDAARYGAAATPKQNISFPATLAVSMSLA